MLTPPRPRRVRPFRLLIIGAGVGMALMIAGLVFTLILGPAIFRSFSPEDQDRIARRLPFVNAWKPTPEFVAPPTIAATSAAALALLGTDVPTQEFVSTPTETQIFIPPSATAPGGIAKTPTTIAPTKTASATSTATATQTASMTPSSTATATTSPTPSATVTQTLIAVAIQPTNTPRQGVAQASTATLTLTPSETATFTPTATPTHTATFTETPLPSETPTLPPTATETPTETPTFPPTPTAFVLPTTVPTTPPALPPMPPSLRLSKMEWVPQTFNNCGPANLTQALRFLGWQEDQANIASAIRPNRNDKNTSPDELVNYVNTQTRMRALWRVGGSLNLVKYLAFRGYGVLIETGFYDPDEPQQGWIGHYRTVMGYDDNQGILIEMDSYKNVKMEAYPTVDELWSHFNRVYIIVYPPAREMELMAILGPQADMQQSIVSALETARAEARVNPQNPFAWFNMGTNYTLLGQYQEAALAYDQTFALGTLPFRVTWYQYGPFESYYQTGQFEKAMRQIEFTMTSAKNYVEEMFYYRGLISAARGNIPAALDDMNAALAFNRSFQPAAIARKQIQDGTFRAPAEQR